MFGILPDLEDKERPTGKLATSKILIKTCMVICYKISNHT